MSADTFNRAFEHVVKIEGGYSDIAEDSGGKTKFGITEAVARANGYTGEMRDLSLDFAKSIYKLQYWDTLRLDEIAVISEPIAQELFDTSVNAGVAVAGQFLQRALNALNRQQQDYPDMKVDGIVGPVTVAAVKVFLTKRGQAGEVVLLRALNSLQGAKYIELSERREKDETFTFGWLLHRVT